MSDGEFTVMCCCIKEAEGGKEDVWEPEMCGVVKKLSLSVVRCKHLVSAVLL